MNHIKPALLALGLVCATAIPAFAGPVGRLANGQALATAQSEALTSVSTKAAAATASGQERSATLNSSLSPQAKAQIKTAATKAADKASAARASAEAKRAQVAAEAK